MNFVKGMLAGVMVGAAVGVMNSEEIMGAIKKGKRYIRKMKNNYGI